MKSNYKRIGDFIQLIKQRNSDMKATELLGININKFFMPSVANVVGTDLSRYKVVEKNQFACNRMHVGRDYRIPVAMSNRTEPFMVSPAYDVFEITDKSILNPEYLMMWFSRAEFDRNAWFYTDADVRGGLSWDAFCSIELPVPSPKKQREIVKEYNTIVNRIKLNEQLNQKLEETAQALYKHWFVDFEFPDENGKPYKSSGGALVWCEELQKEIPKKWEYTNIQTLIDSDIIFKNQDGNHGEIHPKTSDYVSLGIPFIMAKDINNGTVNIKECNFITKEHSKKLRIDPAVSGDVLLTHKATMGRVAIVPEIEDYLVLTPQVTYYRVKNEMKINKEFLYCLFNSYEFQTILNGESEQSTRNFLSITNQRLVKILLPAERQINEFKKKVSSILYHKLILTKAHYKLNELLQIINAKMTKVETEIEVV